MLKLSLILGLFNLHLLTVPTLKAPIMAINGASCAFRPRVCLCRRRRLKTGSPTPAPVSPSWPGRDKPPAHAAPTQATSSQLPQGRWLQGREKKNPATNYLTDPPNLHTVDVPFLRHTIFHSFLMEVLVFLHSAY